MTLYLVSTLLLTALTFLVVAAGGQALDGLQAIVLLPALVWFLLRMSGRWRARLPVETARDPRQPLTLFAQHSGQPALLVDGGRITNANRALLRALGLEERADEVLGMPVDTIVHPRHQSRLASLLKAGATSSDAGTITLLRADGLPWPAQVRLFRGDGSPVTLLEFGEGADSDSLPRAASQWAPRLVHGAGEVMFALDHQLLLAWLNPQWERLTGRTVADSLFMPFLPMFHLEDRVALTQGLRQLQARQRDSLTLEVRTLAGRGSGVRWMELRAWPGDSLDQSGDGSIVGLLLDIDQRRRNEEALRAQRRSLHTMLDNLPGMIYRGQNDRHWTMEFVSEGCFELTGYTPLELVDNHSASFAELIHPEDRDFVWNYVQMRLTRRERYELSYRIVDRDGQVHWVWEQGRGIYSSRGEFLGLEGFITDVSGSRGAQEEARRRLFFDNATGLLGFSLFLDRLQHLIVHAPIAGYPFLLLQLELTRLDEIAARHGPAMAERVMVESGKRLRVIQSECNVAARHGNGFAVLVADFRPAALPWLPADECGTPEARPEAIAAALQRLLDQSLRVEGHTLEPGVRYRIAPLPPGGGDAQAVLGGLLAGA